MTNTPLFLTATSEDRHLQQYLIHLETNATGQLVDISSNQIPDSSVSPTVMLDMTGSLPPGSWPNTGSASISPTTGASFNLRDRLKERELFGDKTMLVFHAKIPSVVAEDTIVMLISKSDDAYVWVKASNQNLYLHAGGVDYIVPGGVFGSSWRKFYLYSSRATNGTWYSKFRISSSFASMPVAHFHIDTITYGKEAFEWDIAKPGAIDLQICSVVICPSVKHSMDLRSSTGLPGNWSNLHEPSGYPLYSGTKTLWKFNGPLTDTTSNKHYYSLDSTAIRMFSGANVELTGPPFLPWTDRALKFDTADSTNTSHGYEGPGYTAAENASDFTWEITIRIDQNISSGYASILTIDLIAMKMSPDGQLYFQTNSIGSVPFGDDVFEIGKWVKIIIQRVDGHNFVSAGGKFSYIGTEILRFQSAQISSSNNGFNGFVATTSESRMRARYSINQENLSLAEPDLEDNLNLLYLVHPEASGPISDSLSGIDTPISGTNPIVLSNTLSPFAGGTSMELNSSSQFITKGASDAGFADDDLWTYEFWIRIESGEPTGIISTSGTDYEISLSYDSVAQKILITNNKSTDTAEFIGTGSTINLASSSTDNTWNHIFIRSDGEIAGNIKVGINGEIATHSKVVRMNLSPFGEQSGTPAVATIDFNLAEISARYGYDPYDISQSTYTVPTQRLLGGLEQGVHNASDTIIEFTLPSELILKENYVENIFHLHYETTDIGTLGVVNNHMSGAYDSTVLFLEPGPGGMHDISTYSQPGHYSNNDFIQIQPGPNSEGFSGVQSSNRLSRTGVGRSYRIDVPSEITDRTKKHSLMAFVIRVSRIPALAEDSVIVFLSDSPNLYLWVPGTATTSGQTSGVLVLHNDGIDYPTTASVPTGSQTILSIISVQTLSSIPGNRRYNLYIANAFVVIDCPPIKIDFIEFGESASLRLSDKSGIRDLYVKSCTLAYDVAISATYYHKGVSSPKSYGESMGTVRRFVDTSVQALWTAANQPVSSTSITETSPRAVSYAATIEDTGAPYLPWTNTAISITRAGSIYMGVSNSASTLSSAGSTVEFILKIQDPGWSAPNYGYMIAKCYKAFIGYSEGSLFVGSNSTRRMSFGGDTFEFNKWIKISIIRDREHRIWLSAGGRFQLWTGSTVSSSFEKERWSFGGDNGRYEGAEYHLAHYAFYSGSPLFDPRLSYKKDIETPFPHLSIESDRVVGASVSPTENYGIATPTSLVNDSGGSSIVSTSLSFDHALYPLKGVATRGTRSSLKVSNGGHFSMDADMGYNNANRLGVVMEFWIRVEEKSGSGFISTHRGDTNGFSLFYEHDTRMIRVQNTRPQSDPTFHLASGAVLNVATSPEDNTWNHVFLQYESSTNQWVTCVNGVCGSVTTSNINVVTFRMGHVDNPAWSGFGLEMHVADVRAETGELQIPYGQTSRPTPTNAMPSVFREGISQPHETQYTLHSSWAFELPGPVYSSYEYQMPYGDVDDGPVNRAIGLIAESSKRYGTYNGLALGLKSSVEPGVSYLDTSKWRMPKRHDDSSIPIYNSTAGAPRDDVSRSANNNLILRATTVEKISIDIDQTLTSGASLPDLPYIFMRLAVQQITVEPQIVAMLSFDHSVYLWTVLDATNTPRLNITAGGTSHEFPGAFTVGAIRWIGVAEAGVANGGTRYVLSVNSARATVSLSGLKLDTFQSGAEIFNVVPSKNGSGDLFFYYVGLGFGKAQSAITGMMQAGTVEESPSFHTENRYISGQNTQGFTLSADTLALGVHATLVGVSNDGSGVITGSSPVTVEDTGTPYLSWTNKAMVVGSSGQIQSTAPYSMFNGATSGMLEMIIRVDTDNQLIFRGSPGLNILVLSGVLIARTGASEWVSFGNDVFELNKWVKISIMTTKGKTYLSAGGRWSYLNGTSTSQDAFSTYRAGPSTYLSGYGNDDIYIAHISRTFGEARYDTSQTYLLNSTEKSPEESTDTILWLMHCLDPSDLVRNDGLEGQSFYTNTGSIVADPTKSPFSAGVSALMPAGSSLAPPFYPNRPDLKALGFTVEFWLRIETGLASSEVLFIGSAGSIKIDQTSGDLVYGPGTTISGSDQVVGGVPGAFKFATDSNDNSNWNHVILQVSPGSTGFTHGLNGGLAHEAAGVLNYLTYRTGEGQHVAENSIVAGPEIFSSVASSYSIPSEPMESPSQRHSVLNVEKTYEFRQPYMFGLLRDPNVFSLTYEDIESVGSENEFSLSYIGVEGAFAESHFGFEYSDVEAVILTSIFQASYTDEELVLDTNEFAFNYAIQVQDWEDNEFSVRYSYDERQAPLSENEFFLSSTYYLGFPGIEEYDFGLSYELSPDTADAVIYPTEMSWEYDRTPFVSVDYAFTSRYRNDVPIETLNDFRIIYEFNEQPQQVYHEFAFSSSYSSGIPNDRVFSYFLTYRDTSKLAVTTTRVYGFKFRNHSAEELTHRFSLYYGDSPWDPVDTSHLFRFKYKEYKPDYKLKQFQLIYNDSKFGPSIVPYKFKAPYKIQRLLDRKNVFGLKYIDVQPAMSPPKFFDLSYKLGLQRVTTSEFRFFFTEATFNTGSSITWGIPYKYMLTEEAVHEFDLKWKMSLYEDRENIFSLPSYIRLAGGADTNNSTQEITTNADGGKDFMLRLDRVEAREGDYIFVIDNGSSYESFFGAFRFPEESAYPYLLELYNERGVKLRSDVAQGFDSLQFDIANFDLDSSVSISVFRELDDKCILAFNEWPSWTSNMEEGLRFRSEFTRLDSGRFKIYPLQPSSCCLLKSGTLCILPPYSDIENTVDTVETIELAWINVNANVWLTSEVGKNCSANITQAMLQPDKTVALMTTDVVGPGKISFEWQINTTGGDSLWFEAHDDISIQAEPPATEFPEPQLIELEIGTGRFMLEWFYIRDVSTAASSDNAILRKIQYVRS